MWITSARKIKPTASRVPMAALSGPLLLFGVSLDQLACTLLARSIRVCSTSSGSDSFYPQSLGLSGGRRVKNGCGLSTGRSSLSEPTTCHLPRGSTTAVGTSSMSSSTRSSTSGSTAGGSNTTMSWPPHWTPGLRCPGSSFSSLLHTDPTSSSQTGGEILCK